MTRKTTTYCLILAFLMSIVIPSESFSQSKVKNLGLKTVVIDPGHGGKDPGALGRGKGIHEKHIVLAVSKLLGQKITKAYPDVKVVYTRSNDTFIGLHERAMVARRNNADLFISIHCNGSANSEARGTSVHILGQNSNNKKNKTDYFERNMTTAQRENSVIMLEDDYQTKYQSFDPNSPESFISHKLQWMAYYESSLLFASEVVEHLIQKPLTPRKIVVDQDIFQVLVEANMPAVLLELAFVTNPTEYKYLSSAAGQDAIAERLFKAFKSYKTKFDESMDVQMVEEVEQPVVKDNQDRPEYFGIQIMGLGKKLSADDPALKGLKCQAVKGENSSVYKYIYGKFATFEDCKKHLATVRRKFPEAFPVKVKGSVVERAR